MQFLHILLFFLGFLDSNLLVLLFHNCKNLIPSNEVFIEHFFPGPLWCTGNWAKSQKYKLFFLFTNKTLFKKSTKKHNLLHHTAVTFPSLINWSTSLFVRMSEVSPAGFNCISVLVAVLAHLSGLLPIIDLDKSNFLGRLGIWHSSTSASGSSVPPFAL